jgi:hypothetical protein
MEGHPIEVGSKVMLNMTPYGLVSNDSNHSFPLFYGKAQHTFRYSALFNWKLSRFGSYCKNHVKVYGLLSPINFFFTDSYFCLEMILVSNGK